MCHLVVLCNDLRVRDRTAVLDNPIVAIIALCAAARANLPWYKDLLVLSRLAASTIPFSSTTTPLPLSLTLTLPLTLVLTLPLTLPLLCLALPVLPLTLILVPLLCAGTIRG